VSVDPPPPRSVVVELCGLPGAGKSSLASAIGAMGDRLGVAFPTAGIAPDVPAGRRIARKLGLCSVETARRPALEATMIRQIVRSGQPSPAGAVSRWVQWASTQSLMGRARGVAGVHVFDEGVLQSLWSLGLRGDPEATLRTLAASVGRWSSPDLVIVLDPPVELLAGRLRDRPSSHSRLQRVSDDAELHAELVVGRSLLERLAVWWEAIAPVEASLVRMRGEHGDPGVAMVAIDAAVRRIEATTAGSYAVARRRGGSKAGP
jgi:hypothetical protein